MLQRLYHDYLLPRRTSEYGHILQEAALHGYSFETISSFDKVLKSGLEEGLKYLIIRREAYDPEQMDHVTCRIADQNSPDFMKETRLAIERNEPVIYLLTHPRQWGADWNANTRDNVSRLIRGLLY